jgi:uncharacterized protein (TIGR01777 family)
MGRISKDLCSMLDVPRDGLPNPADAPKMHSGKDDSMKKPRIILAGGSGYLGQLLAPRFVAKNYQVIVLTRSPQKRSGEVEFVQWDGSTLGDWAGELEGAAAVINLTGRSVNCRYTEVNRRLILESRVLSTRVLGKAIARCAQPPRVWLNTSTATIYKHSFNRALDEAGEMGGTREAKDEFSVEVARAWEQAFDEARTPATRKVTLRLTMVFGAAEGTVFRVLRRLARWGLGGKMASGKQFVSWIHEEDFWRAIQWLVLHDSFGGPVNLASPHPLTNCEMMRILRQECGAPLGIGLPATRWMLEIGAFFLRTETELIIKSRRVVPGRLAAAGFQFSFPKLEDAVHEIEKRMKAEEREK